MSSPIAPVGLRQDPMRGAFTTTSGSVHDILNDVPTTPLIPSGPYLCDEDTRFWHSQCSAEEHADWVRQILGQYLPTATRQDDATDNVVHYFAGAFTKHLTLFQALNEYREDKLLAKLFKNFADASTKALNLAFNRDRIMWPWKQAILDAIRAERELTRELLEWHTPSLEQIFQANESFLYAIKSRERAGRTTANNATDRAILYEDLLADLRAEYIDLEPVLDHQPANSQVAKRLQDMERLRQEMLGELERLLERAMLGGRLGEEDLTRRREAVRAEKARRAARMRAGAAIQTARMRAARRRAALGMGPRWRHRLRSGRSWNCVE